MHNNLTGLGILNITHAYEFFKIMNLEAEICTYYVVTTIGPSSKLGNFWICICMTSLINKGSTARPDGQNKGKGCSMQWICGNNHLWISWVQDSIQQMDARTGE